MQPSPDCVINIYARKFLQLQIFKLLRAQPCWLTSFVNGEQKWVDPLYNYLILTPHFPPLFMTSGIQAAAQDSQPCFRNFQTSILNKHDQKSSEKVRCVSQFSFHAYYHVIHEASLPWFSFQQNVLLEYYNNSVTCHSHGADSGCGPWSLFTSVFL